MLTRNPERESHYDYNMLAQFSIWRSFIMTQVPHLAVSCALLLLMGISYYFFIQGPVDMKTQRD